MDEELFELCKEVYERTAWQPTGYFDGEYIVTQEDADAGGYDDGQLNALYTSDYLLEKLPAKLAYNKTEYFYYLEKFGDGSYGSGYGFTDEGGHIDHPMIGVLTDNVALKVNLKLVIALDDAGQLVAAETTA